jgi:predicted metal-dependent hydrolase
MSQPIDASVVGADAAAPPVRSIRARRVDLAYPSGLPRHFVQGDIGMSHVVAMLSAVFPEGEDFFVRTVRNHRSDIDDPVLKGAVAGFIGQEAMHGREHRTFNDALARLGYPTRVIDGLTGRGLRFAERILPAKVQLAITAALEHYTASLAELLLESPDARELLDIPEVRSLFLWHALEESEHKAVAFDVYRHAGGSERVRRWVMDATTVGFLVGVLAAVLLSVLLDREARRHPFATGRSLWALRRSPWLTRAMAGRIRAYNRVGFHPDDFDNAELTERWRVELFGPGAVLAGSAVAS